MEHAIFCQKHKLAARPHLTQNFIRSTSLSAANLEVRINYLGTYLVHN